MNRAVRILILGDGTAGLNVANKLSVLLGKDEAFITVVGSSSRHYYKGSGFLIPFGYCKPSESYKPLPFLLNPRVEHIRDEVTGIRVKDRTVITKKRTLNYDYLIIATGTSFAYDRIPGYLGEAKHFYDFEHSMELKGILNDFTGGTIVVGTADLKAPCPPAPFEFAVLLDQFLREKGIRDKTKIKYVYPAKNVFLIDKIAPVFEAKLKEIGVEIETEFQTDSIIQKNHEIHSTSGKSINYDLLIMVPPVKGQDFIAESGLDHTNNFAKVDKNTLNPEGHDEIFVIGDAADLPVPKAATSAIFAAEYVSKKIASNLGDIMLGSEYEGDVGCTLYFGDGEGMTVYFAYEKAISVQKPKRFDYLLKKMEADMYFSGIVRGMM